MKEITELQKSALQEVGNIGSGHAAIALSQLMGRKIMIAIPTVTILELSTFNNLLRNANDNFVHVSLSVLGDVEGIMIFSLLESMAFKLCDIVLGKTVKDSTKKLNDFEQSALKEIGNIVSSAYLNAINKMTRFTMIVSAPDYKIGNLMVMEDIILKKKINKKNIDKVMCIKTAFIEADAKVEGDLFFIPISDAIDKIVKALGV